ncbi:unnamed protein product [Coccothraustes coccothraustes]
MDSKVTLPFPPENSHPFPNVPVGLVLRVQAETPQGLDPVPGNPTLLSCLSPGWECCPSQGDREGSGPRAGLSSLEALLSDPALPSRASLPLCWKPPQENERLRTQALKKAKEEKEENSKKESELLRARRELEALRKKHQKLSKKLLKYSPFKRYLEDVVENSQFRDIDDVISYYKALLRTRKDLLQSQWWHRQLMEQGKGLQQQLRAEKEAEMLQCRNDLAQLEESFAQAQSDIRQWEDRWAQVQDRAARKAVELRCLTMAIQGLFHTASVRLQPQGRVAAGDSHRQLDMIQQFIHDLQDFTEDMKERGRAL